MKNKCKILVVLTFAVLFLFYRFDSVVAMANEQFGTSGSNSKPASESEMEQVLEPVSESEAEQILEPVSESETEQILEPVSEPETEQIPAPASGSEAEQSTEPAIETASDYISTGPALIDWLESHKNTGGSAKLTDNVVLDGYYAFCPAGINMPHVFVDTDKYTITVAGEIELFSDYHLTFLGQPDGKGIFYVAPKGALSVSGVAVESGQCALWQEEGAGLVLEDCHISGNIHYADTPFVMYENSICVIVEKGQTVNDVLPTQLECTVNSQGDVSHHEAVSVSWALEGTEKQQEERLRFKLQGSFLHAASREALFCTVVYNDYPLTFTNMKASLCYNTYLFLGGYTKPEECLPITVISEYSFDGENWLMYEEKVVSSSGAHFELCLALEQWDTAAYPDIYIRQQWDDNGTIHFSNVLCYAAENLEYEHDIGGSRGGGTSITTPPAEPHRSTDDPSSEKQAENSKSDSGSGKAESESPSDADQTENGDNDAGLNAASDEQPSDTGMQNTGTGKSSNTGTQNTGAGKPSNTESQNTGAGKSSNTGLQSSVNGQSSYLESKTDNGVRIANNPDNKESIGQITEQTLHSDISQGNNIVIALGFVVLSVIAGIVGFCAHAGIFRSRFYAVKRALFK